MSKDCVNLTLGTSLRGLHFATAPWKTLNFEKVEQQITYPMSIMKHVFVYLVFGETLEASNAGRKKQENILTNYGKLSDTEFDIEQNLTDKTVYVINAEKKHPNNDSHATITVFPNNPNTYIGIEFSGDGKRVFGSSKKSIIQLFEEKGIKITPRDPREMKLEQGNRKIVTDFNNKNKFTTDYFHGNQGIVPISVDFVFGVTHDGKQYNISNQYNAYKNHEFKSLVETPTPIYITFDIQFYVHNHEGNVYIGFSPIPYVSQLQYSPIPINHIESERQLLKLEKQRAELNTVEKEFQLGGKNKNINYQEKYLLYKQKYYDLKNNN